VHRYLRSIGFSKIENRQQLQSLINEVVEKTILHPDKENDKKQKKYVCARDIAADERDHVYAELSLDFVHGAGICVRGEFDEMDAMMYKIEGEDLYLIGTSEHSMIGKFIDTIIPEAELPKTLTSYSPCFRK